MVHALVTTLAIVLLGISASADAATVASVQRRTMTLTGTSATVTIDAVDASKAFLLFTLSLDENEPSRGGERCLHLAARENAQGRTALRRTRAVLRRPRRAAAARCAATACARGTLLAVPSGTTV